jgi:hypothetical protein
VTSRQRWVVEVVLRGAVAWALLAAFGYYVLVPYVNGPHSTAVILLAMPVALFVSILGSMGVRS